jgi:chromosomal replication initiation ATPase DnaA
MSFAEIHPASGAPASGHVESSCALDALVAAAFAVPAQALHAATRGSARIARARQTAMYLAHVVLGMSCAQAGRWFGRDRTTVAHACRVIEEQRDDPALDALLHALEGRCANLQWNDGAAS